MTSTPDPTELLKALGVAVAAVNVSDLGVLYENAQFFHWFPATGDGDESLTERVPGIPQERLAARLAEGKAFTIETDVGVPPRTTTVRVEVRPLPDAPGTAVVQALDISGEQRIQFMLDSYSELAERNARDLQKEKERVERLLLNIMPRAVFEEMKDFGTTTPQRFEAASILMLDFVGFTDMAISHDPSALISELNDIFSAFDRIVDMFDCERLRTMGDAYMAVSGIPEATPNHARNIARVALRMRRYLERRNAAHPQQWVARIGINTGPVIGSLVGISKYVYDLFGPGVNLAARMEAISEPMKITLNDDTRIALADQFTVTERGEYEIKGFGTQKLYFLEGEVK
jgi:adenylate cyclase